MKYCHECGCELVDPKEHSDPMRRMFFAEIRNIWGNLPDALREIYPSSESFRKAALINIGWCENTMTVCGSDSAAHDVSLLVKGMDIYVICTVEGPVVQTFRARSIAKRACPLKQFHDVADKALTWAHQQIGIERKSA